MKCRTSGPVIFSVTLVLVWSGQVSSSTCPNACSCKWINGKLTALCMDKNLFSVPTGLHQDTQVVDLRKNNFQVLPNRIFQERGLGNLQKIFMPECRLGNLSPEAFHHLTNLIELDLTHNLLTSVPTDALKGVHSLRKLQLGQNPIAVLRNGSFSGLRSLTNLDLSNCQLQNVDIGAFHGLNSLEYLKLDGNQLVTLKAESVSVLPRLSSLELQGNPWVCDCHLSNLRQWMETRNVPMIVPPTCENPPRLKDSSWQDLEFDDFACLPDIGLSDLWVTVEEGQNATLICRVRAQPQAVIRWEPADWIPTNTTIDPDRFRFHQEDNLYYQISYLTVSSTIVEDSGVYVCSAENRAGSASANFTLGVFKPPPPVVGMSKAQIVIIVLGLFLVVVVIGVVLCIVVLRQRAIAAASDGKFPSVNFLKHLAGKRPEVVEVTTPNKADFAMLDKPPPRQETGSSGYGSDQQQTPDLVSKGGIEANGPYANGRNGAIIMTQLPPDTLPANGDIYGDRVCLANGYSNPIEDASYCRYAQYDLSDYTINSSKETLEPGVSSRTCNGSPPEQSPWRDDTYFSHQSSPAHPSVVAQQQAGWKRTPLVVPHNAHLPIGPEARYSPDEGYAEGTYEGTEV